MARNALNVRTTGSVGVKGREQAWHRFCLPDSDFIFLLELQILLTQHTVQLFNLLSDDVEVMRQLRSHQCYLLVSYAFSECSLMLM